jgi:hypothetical protein
MSKVYLTLLSLVFLVSSGLATASVPEKPASTMTQTAKSKKPAKKVKKLHKKHHGTKVPVKKK